jgi:hypothetical protein
MNSRFRLRAPSPAMVLAVAALFVALGGAAYAVNLGKNDVKSRNIAPKAVKGSDIATNAVKRSKIKGNAVNAAKIAEGAVDQSELAEDAVSRRKIKAQAVTTPKIADAAVETDKLGDGAVTTGKLADGAVTSPKLGPNSVTGVAFLASETVTVDPMPGDDDCVRESESVDGVDSGDHAVVTTTIGDVSPDYVATGDTDDNEVGVTVCNVGGGAVSSTDVKVLVIDG